MDVPRKKLILASKTTGEGSSCFITRSISSDVCPDELWGNIRWGVEAGWGVDFVEWVLIVLLFEYGLGVRERVTLTHGSQEPESALGRETNRDASRGLSFEVEEFSRGR